MNSETIHRPRCIGIDPGTTAKPSAFAWISDAGDWIVTSHNNASSIYNEIDDAHFSGVEIAVIEDCFLGPNAKSYKMLAVEQGRLRMAAELAGLRVHIVHPSTWMAASLSSGGRAPKKHADIARVAIMRAKDITTRDLSEDEAMAVCIADWGECHLQAETEEEGKG